MKIPNLFARRYLFSRNSRSVINIISGVSIGAVAVPVAAMIILLSVFNGFETIIRGMRSSFDADITVTAARGASFAADELPKSAVAAVEGVGAVSYIVEQGALAGYLDRKVAATVRGVDEDYGLVLPAAETVTAGEYVVQRGDDLDFAIPGQGLAYELGVRSFVADDITIYAMRRNSFSTLLPVDGYSSAKLPVSGLFAVDAQTDGGALLTSLRAAQRLFDYEGRVSALLVRSDGTTSPESLRRSIEAVAGDGFRVRTRDEMNASLYRIMRYEKWGIFAIALIILVIASLSVVGALVMLIIEKRRDRETLRALGADLGLVRRIFIAEGMLICSIGGAAGVVAGVALSLVQQYCGVITLPARTMAVSVYPVELHAADALLVVAAFAAVARMISAVTVRSMIKKEV